MAEKILTFDFGTTCFKAAVVDAHGQIEALVRVPTPTTIDHDRHEIAPRTFLRTVLNACEQLAASKPAGLSDVAALTFCSQANTFLLLDADNQPLTPLIVWTDQRAGTECADIATWTLDPDYVSRSGLPAIDTRFTPAKLRWLAAHHPNEVERTRRLCFLSDYLTLWLTGEHVTDGTLAGFSGLFDSVAWGWAPEWAGQVNAKVSWFPRVLRAGQPVATVKPQMAGRLSLPPSCRVVMGLMDQHAGAFGAGNVRDGAVSETTGTVLATVRCTHRRTFRQGGTSGGTANSPLALSSYRSPAPMAGHWYDLVFSEVSASLLDTLRVELPGAPSAADLDDLVDIDQPSPLVLNPRDDIHVIRATLRAWAKSQPTGDVVRAIYDCVAAELVAQVRHLAGDGPVPMVRAAGGAARSRKWLQIKADALGCPVLTPATDEPTLVGAASVTAEALGWRKPSPGQRDHGDRLIHPRRSG